MDDPLDIQLYPQPWITFSLVFHMTQERDAHASVEWSLKAAQNHILNSLADWLISGLEHTDYESFQSDSYYGGEISESDYMILDAMRTGQQNPLSISETDELIERLDNIFDDYEARYTPRPTPGPWARAERDQLFDWILSRIRRYAQVKTVSDNESIDWSQAPMYAVLRQIQGQSEMHPREIASRLSAERDLQIRVPHAANLPPTLQNFNVLEVRLPRELPDGSPEALGVTVLLDKQVHEWGHPPIIK